MSGQAHWRRTESTRMKGVEVKQRVQMSSNTSSSHCQVDLHDKEHNLDYREVGRAVVVRRF